MRDIFLVVPTAQQTLAHLSGAGVQLQNLALQDAGTYQVHVYLQGVAEVQVRSVQVEVSGEYRKRGKYEEVL